MWCGRRYRNGCRRCSSNCPPCVRMPTMKTVTTTVKEGSPMTVESRIFSVAEYVQPSEGEPIRSVVLETRDSIIVVWHVHPGQEIAAHIHPHGQDTWTVLSGMADYFQGNGIVRALREGEIAVARPGQVHGARNTGTEPFVLVSVVASANAGFVLAER
ncbi:cupin region [Escherichia coli E1114]|nr:cupin region [Escherichia coli E1114]